MKIVLSDLPDGVGDGDLEELVSRFAEVESVELLDEDETDRPECLVTLRDPGSRAAAEVVADRLNGYYWKETRITARLLLFDEGNEAEPR